LVTGGKELGMNWKTLVAAGLLVGPVAAHAQTAAINLTTPGEEYSASPYTLGFEFSVNSSTTITALGVYDSGGTALGAPAEVGIWDTSGDLLASATVPSGTGGTLDGLFRYTSISGFNAVAGTDYIIGAYLSTGNASSLGTDQGGTGSVNSDVNIILDQYSESDDFAFPSLTDNHAGGAWLGANFLIGTASTSVPEPATLALLSLGLAGVGFLRRRKAA